MSIQNFNMIDVGAKAITRRRALAEGRIYVCQDSLTKIKARQTPKGDVLAMAEVAGIMAAKNVASLLPLCHPLLLDSVRIWFDLAHDHIVSFCEVICHAKTGVEMEALAGVNAALLTIYDLAKAMDPVIEISGVKLLLKEGGKSGLWQHPSRGEQTENSKADLNKAEVKQTEKIVFANLAQASVITLSDRASKQEYPDISGQLLKEFLLGAGAVNVHYQVIADDAEVLKANVLFQIREFRSELLLLTGGTGIGPRDITPETLRPLAVKELSGLGECQRYFGSQFTKMAWFSRSTAFVIEGTLVILFPGSPKAVQQGLEAIGSLLPHALKMLRGESHG